MLILIMPWHGTSWHVMAVFDATERRIMLGVARRALIINMRSYPAAGNGIARSMVSLVTLITQYDILVNIHYRVLSTKDKSWRSS
jgi:hypothetical protein